MGAGWGGHRQPHTLRLSSSRDMCAHTCLPAQDYSGPSSAAILKVRSRRPGSLREPRRVCEANTNSLTVLRSHWPFSPSFPHESTVEFCQWPHDTGCCTRLNAEADIRRQASSRQTLDCESVKQCQLLPHIFVLENIVVVNEKTFCY